MRRQTVAVAVLNDILRPGGDRAVDHARHRQAGLGQALGIASSDRLAAVDLVLKNRQLLDQYGGLQGIEAGIHADAGIEVFGIMVAEGRIVSHRLAMYPQ